MITGNYRIDQHSRNTDERRAAISEKLKLIQAGYSEPFISSFSSYPTPLSTPTSTARKATIVNDIYDEKIAEIHSAAQKAMEKTKEVIEKSKEEKEVVSGDAQKLKSVIISDAEMNAHLYAQAYASAYVYAYRHYTTGN